MCLIFIKYKIERELEEIYKSVLRKSVIIYRRKLSTEANKMMKVVKIEFSNPGAGRSIYVV